MNKEFVMRGQTASGETEILNFSGYKPGYAYRLVELKLYPSENIGGKIGELAVSITAGKTYVDPTYPNFNNEGLIATACIGVRSDAKYYDDLNVVNDTFLITQNLILAAIDTETGSPMPVNWQCRFVAEKINTSEGAVANYKQFTISNE